MAHPFRGALVGLDATTLTRMTPHPLDRRSPWTRLVPAVVLLAIAVAIWPFAAGLRAANDDVKWVRAPDHAEPILQALRSAWSKDSSFRPLEVLVAHASDDVTLESTAAACVQAAGLAAALLGLRRLCRLCCDDCDALFVPAALFLLLSPATTCSAWQIDTCSQTWAAALGAWAVALAWEAVIAARSGTVPWRSLMLLVLVCGVAVNLKETFYGWSLGLGVVTLGAAAWMARSNRAAAARASLVLLPTVAIPVAHLLLRVATGPIKERLTMGEGDRYQIELGMNLVINAGMSVGGALATGPFHLLTDDHAHALLRMLPLASILVAGAMLLITAGFAIMARSWPAGLRPGALAFSVSACMLSLSATLPMGSVSELYGFGANIGVAIAFAACVHALLGNQQPDERRIARGACVASVAVLAAVGAYGLASRAAHYRITWEAADRMNKWIVDFQPTLAPTAGGGEEAAGAVYLGELCILDRTYGQYVIPPAQAINPEATEPWLARRDPQRRIVFALGTPPAGDRRCLAPDCSTLTSHGHW
jgi:hypothetical protein